MKTKKSLLSHSKPLIVAMIFACAFAIPRAHAQNCVGDSLALVEIYNATNGASWTTSANWLTGPLATWQGVQVTNNRVTSLSLPFNNLTGSLTYHLGFLQELTSLDLPGNQLAGSVPASLVFLQKLKKLDLSGNNLTGQIPATLGLTLSLTSVNLSDNALSGSIPTSFLLLSRLVYLNLSNNQLSGSIPATIGYLTKLQTLSVANNKLSGSIPSTISNLKSVREVLLFNNNLSGNVPAAVGQLDSVVVFNAANNKLTGTVPATVANLRFLYFFNVESNRISDLPNLSSSTSLLQLYVANNKLTFADIEPNIALVRGGNYAPQDSIGVNTIINVCEGQTLTIPGNYIEASPNNTYTWFTTDFSFIGEPSSNAALVIPNATIANSGRYSVEVANSVATDLFLYRRSVRVNVKVCTTTSKTQDATVQVFPIPFEQTTTVQAGSEATPVVVKDSNGTILESYNAQANETVQIGAKLQGGTYFVETFQNGKKEVVRVVKK